MISIWRKRSNDLGVSNVVSIIMITGIITSVMGMVFTTYLPAWGKDVEAQTLNEAMDSFMDLKSSLETLSVRADPGTTTTTKITLGSGGGPVFGFGRFSGSFSLRADEGQISLTDDQGNNFASGRGALRYSSSNTYVNDQDITLEGGAIIREQAGSAALKGSPNLLVFRDQTSGETFLYLIVPTIEGDTGSYSGSGTYMTSVTLLSSQVIETEPAADDTITYTVSTEYSDVWDDHVTSMMTEQGVDAADYSTDTSVDGEFSMSITGLDSVVVRATVYQLSIS